MGRLFDFESPIMQWLQKIATVIFCGFFWLLLCLPVITAGASTTAMFTQMFHLRQDKAVSVKEFFVAFGQNFIKSTVLWIIDLLALGGLYFLLSLLFGLDVAGAMQLPLMIISFLLIFVFLTTTAYLFPLTAYFENTVLNTIKNAFFMSVGHLRQTIPILALLSFPFTLAIIVGNLSYDLFYYIFLYPLPVWIFVMLPLILYWQSYFFLLVFEEYTGSQLSTD